MGVKRRPAEYPTSSISPRPWDYANRRPMFSPGISYRSVDLIPPSERAIDPDLINKALVIIAPNGKDISSCHSAVVYGIWRGRETNYYGTNTILGINRILAKLKGALQKIKRLVAELPPSLRGQLFAHDLRPRDGKWFFADDAFTEFCAELDTLSIRVNARFETRHGKFHHKKRCAAHIARELMTEFGRRPTTTVDGPFFRLASLIYEAITGVSEANLDRQCREELKIN